MARQSAQSDRSAAAALDRRAVDDLCCVDCGGRLEIEAGAAPPIVNGALRCTACGKRVQVVKGVPRFTGDLGSLKETASSYGYQWSGFWQGLFDREDVFGLQFDQTEAYFLRSLGLDVEALRGKTLLDAGTGSGRIPLSLRGRGARIYAVDMHSGIDVIATRLAGAEGVQVVQANLLTLPFRPEFFDLAWSSGVLMLAPNAGDAFRAIAKKVKPGGRIFISVYGKDVNHYRMFRHLLPGVHHLPVSVVYGLSALIGLPLYLGFNSILWAIRTFKKTPPPHKVAMFTVEDASAKSYKSVVLNLFDQLHPQFQTEHTVAEVREWFEGAGFGDITVTESIGMVAMRGVKSRSA